MFPKFTIPPTQGLISKVKISHACEGLLELAVTIGLVVQRVKYKSMWWLWIQEDMMFHQHRPLELRALTAVQFLASTVGDL